jgi:CheY-like chemotaxis protein
MVEQVGQEAMGVAKSLLTFSRKMPTQKRPTDLASLVANSTQLLRRMLPATIELRVDADGDPPLWADTDATQMHLVVLNLAINARDAMPEGGTLTVTVAPSTADGRIDTRTAAEPAFATVSVSDTGVGMSAEVTPRIFEPFFTTKERGQGTGLGLSIVHGIVEDHGGRVEVRSTPGQGSTFDIILPCVGSDAARGLVAAPPDHAGTKLLVAEEHRLLRELMVSTLRSQEHDVIAAGDAGAVVERLAEEPRDIRLVILDAELAPKAGPDQLADALVAADVPVILISDEPEPHLEARLSDRAVVLRRPFAMPELGELVDSVLGGAPVEGGGA